jgi:hypothetical protein
MDLDAIACRDQRRCLLRLRPSGLGWGAISRAISPTLADGGTTMILGLMLFPLCGITAAAPSSPTDNMAAPRSIDEEGCKDRLVNPRGGANN